jgi:hypothetical protein
MLKPIVSACADAAVDGTSAAVSRCFFIRAFSKLKLLPEIRVSQCRQTNRHPSPKTGLLRIGSRVDGTVADATSIAYVAQTARCLLRNIDKRKVGMPRPNLDTAHHHELGVTIHQTKKLSTGD